MTSSLFFGLVVSSLSLSGLFVFLSDNGPFDKKGILSALIFGISIGAIGAFVCDMPSEGYVRDVPILEITGEDGQKVKVFVFRHNGKQIVKQLTEVKGVDQPCETMQVTTYDHQVVWGMKIDHRDPKFVPK